MADYLPPVVARLSMDMGDFTAKVAAAKAELKGLSGTMNIKTDGLASAAAKVEALNKAVTRGQTTFAPYIAGFRLSGNAVHWLVSAMAEFAAVAIPAIVAGAAGLAVMAPAAINAAQHMQALAQATQASGQMFGQSIGSVLGFSGALQKAQDAAKPAVFGMLGSALITAKEGAGGFAAAGLQVTQMLQTFAAKVAVDFGPHGGLSGGHLFASMTTDLQGLGRVLGNIGHTIANVANAMPGLAEFLLKGLGGITGFLSHLSGAAPLLITIGMGFEELVRWGGLGATIIAKLASGLGALMKVAGLAEAAGKVNAFAKALQALGKTGIGKLQIAGVAALAAGLSFLIYKLATAKNAMQQFGDSLQKATLSASNATVIDKIASNISTLNQKLATTPKVLNGTAQEMMRFGSAMQSVNPEIASGHAAIQKQITDMRNLAQGAAYVAKTYGTTFTGALALADQAGVHLAAGILGTSQAAMIARMQIQSLVQGYQAMGQSAGQVGKDMTAMAIQSGLAATGVSKLNSAWDDFTSNLTGGTSAVAALGESLTNLSTGSNKITTVLGKGGSLTLGVKQFADSLKSFGGAGAVAWQSFNQVISGGQKMLDWMRTAGAEGALSATKFKQAGLDMASALVPLASQSKTAQAEVMGLVQQFDPAIKTFGQLKAAIAGSGASFSGLNGIIGGATAKMANMESVARTLGTVLNSALVSALQAAQVQASGAGAAMQKYAADLMAGNHAAASADYSNLLSDLEKLGLNAQQAAALIAQVTQNLNALNGKTANAYVITHLITTGQSVPSITQGAPAGVRVGHAAGTPSAPSGWAWVGEAGPELVKFRGGEQVLPNQVSMGFANGTGGPYGGDIHLHIDGREIANVVAKRSVQTQRRTGTNGMTKRTR